MPFCDLMKQARSFGGAKSPWDGNCIVGADGWPTQNAFGLIFITETTGVGGIEMDGIYTLRFLGNATIIFAPAAGSQPMVLNSTHDAETDVTLSYIEVPTAGNGKVWIGFEGAHMKGGTAGAKNISLLQPGCSLKDLHALTPALLKLVSRFDSLRYMDWTATNGNLEEKWSDRRTLDAPSYVAQSTSSNTSGIPWEACVKLSNTAQKDMWINIPGHADDAYILALAKLLKETVDPSLFIYYEYANEVWNWQFEVATYNLREANTSVNSGDPHRFNYDNITNPGYYAWRRVAYMCKHIGDLFKTVFGADNVGSGKRVRPLLAGQVSFAAPVKTGLEYIEAVFGAPNQFFHGIAGAPYFGIPTTLNANPNLTVDEIFKGFDENIHNMSIAQGFAEDNQLAVHIALAYHYGLQMRGYEGGPDTNGPGLGKSYLAVKGAANVDPRIEGRIETYLTNWYSWGRAMGPLNYFVAGATNLLDQYGSYGILQDMRLQDSYKVKGVDAIRVKPLPKTPLGIPLVPFTANCTADMVGGRKPVRHPYHCDYFGANTTFDFFLQTAVGRSTLSVTVLVHTTLSNATIGVQLGADPELIVKCPLTISSPGDQWSPCDAALFTVKTPGVDVVRLRSIGWEKKFRAYSIANISFV